MNIEILYIIFLACVIVVSLINILLNLLERKERKKFDSKCESLLQIIRKENACKGSVKLPEYNGKRIYNCETGEEELAFVEYSDDGRVRDIYINSDGSHVTFYPWREDKGDG